MSDWVTISNDTLFAQINPLGAELSVLDDAQGNAYLWNGDPGFWTGRAPILFPIVGRAPADQITLDHGTYPMEKHGFARHSVFSLCERTDDSCVFELTNTAATSTIWPFAFRLSMSFSLSGATLTQRATVENLSADPMPFNFGFHPAFHWPLPNATGPHEIIRDGLDDPPMYRLRDGLLSLQPNQSPFENGRCVPDRSHFDDDAMIFLASAGTGLTFGVPTGPKLHFKFHNLPDLGVWSARDAPFLCIEPWHGADAIDTASDAMNERPSVCTLQPGDTTEFAFSVTITP